MPVGAQTVQVGCKRLPGEDVVFNQHLVARFCRLGVDHVQVDQIVSVGIAFYKRARIAFHQVHLRQIEDIPVVAGIAACRLNDGGTDLDGGDGPGPGQQAEHNILAPSGPDDECPFNLPGGERQILN